jgi:XTP/dITP diphosphohydrolase
VKELLFATNNPHKVKELRSIASGEYSFKSLREVGIEIDIPETSPTLRENAIQKVTFIHRQTGMDGIAEDTGLEVDALNGAPGVFTARFAGRKATADQNIELLLKKLEGNPDRTARFRTYIALILYDELHLFEGVCEGSIATERSGKGGFGYDPVFIPEGYHQTFAELPTDIKNRISHRAKAVRKLIEFLN